MATEPLRDAAPPRSGMRIIVTVIVLAVLAALVVGGWRFARTLRSREPAPTAQTLPAAAPDSAPGAAPDTALAMPMAAGAPFDARLTEMEARLGAIDAAARSAAGDATRAEALLIVAATRRALDRGQPLGYLEPQLQARFGNAQPRAVATIIAAARAPVTLESLRTGLDDAAGHLAAGRDGGVLANARRELGTLFVVRASGAPSPVPMQRIARARRALDIDDADAAIAEIAALPGRAAARDWLAAARRYAEARQALDLVESAAIVMVGPRAPSVPAMPAPTSPVAPTTN